MIFSSVLSFKIKFFTLILNGQLSGKLTIGLYCRTTYTFEITLGTSEVIYSADPKCKNSCLFAIELFSEKSSLSQNTRFKINIEEIESQIIDTIQAVVFYSIIKLLEKEINSKTRVIVTEKGNIQIEK